MTVSQSLLTHTHLTMMDGHRWHAKCPHGCESDPWDRVSYKTGWQHFRQLKALQFLLDEMDCNGELFPVHLAIGVQVGQTPVDKVCVSGNMSLVEVRSHFQLRHIRTCQIW